ncbi:MAG: alpha/beta hydrolase [Treponemataceae bacterium]|nr:alpha/beta hydrolase [Treponemataceae bacterium]
MKKITKRILKILAIIISIFVVSTILLCVISAPRGKTNPTKITMHEAGIQNEKICLLIHPSLVYWDYFEYVVPLLEDEFHVLIPALPGYDKENPESNFTSIEQIAAGIEEWFSENKITKVDAIYGCSMGGSIVLKMISNQKVKIEKAYVDGGITPYKAPWIFTRWIALKDFSLMWMGKLGGIGLLEKAFATDEYSQEDLEYVAEVFDFVSNRTLWNTFDSCNNYKMPKNISEVSTQIEYWYAENEKNERKKDFDFMSKMFPETKFEEMESLGHAGMALFRPEEMAERIKK